MYTTARWISKKTFPAESIWVTSTLIEKAEKQIYDFVQRKCFLRSYNKWHIMGDEDNLNIPNERVRSMIIMHDYDERKCYYARTFPIFRTLFLTST